MNRNRIYSFMNKATFLHVEDSLAIGKLRLFAGHYNNGATDKSVAHFIDVHDARVILFDMARTNPVNIKHYRGRPQNGRSTSRILEIKTITQEPLHYRLELSEGPGKPTTSGAVLPDGPPTTSVYIDLYPDEARRLALAVLEYMTAYAILTFSVNPADVTATEPDEQAQPTMQPATFLPRFEDLALGLVIKVQGRQSVEIGNITALYPDKRIVMVNFGTFEIPIGPERILEVVT